VRAVGLPRPAWTTATPPLLCPPAGACEPERSLACAAAGRESYTPVDLNTSSLKMYYNIVNQMGGQAIWRRLLAVLAGVAGKHQVSVSAVALRWVMQQGGEAGSVVPIVGMRGADHIQDNASALGLQLDASDLAAIDEVLSEAAGPQGDCYSFERGQ